MNMTVSSIWCVYLAIENKITPCVLDVSLVFCVHVS
jgi:hypothetical protein